MRIKQLSVMSNSALNFSFTSGAPICIICGRYSDLALDLIRELTGDYGAKKSPDYIDDGRFIMHADIEIDGKNYKACYIRNADTMGDHRLAVNFKPNSITFTEDDTKEFLEKCSVHAIDTSNVLYMSADIIPCNDKRPIYIYDYFDHLDEAIDITPILCSLASLDRQVYISVCGNYPIERISHNSVQIIDLRVSHIET